MVSSFYKTNTKTTTTTSSTTTTFCGEVTTALLPKSFKMFPVFVNKNNRELLYAPEDITRSSPFFWALEQAFSEQQQQMNLLRQTFAITDAIPSPLKDVGPAYQTIVLEDGMIIGSGKGSGSGRIIGQLISRVKVATLNGKATSIMTTRADIVDAVGVDALNLRIESTTVEESTVITTLFPGPLGDWIKDRISDIPFPSGQVLERIQPGSSTVVMTTTFCDESIRISRRREDHDNHKPHQPNFFVWRRCQFAGSERI
jgi:hypothetical protein